MFFLLIFLKQDRSNYVRWIGGWPGLESLEGERRQLFWAAACRAGMLMGDAWAFPRVVAVDAARAHPLHPSCPNNFRCPNKSRCLNKFQNASPLPSGRIICSTNMDLSLLPENILLQILGYLEVRDLQAVACTNKWGSIALTPSLWRKVVIFPYYMVNYIDFADRIRRNTGVRVQHDWMIPPGVPANQRHIKELKRAGKILYPS